MARSAPDRAHDGDLRGLRELLGKTQEELASLLGRSQRQVSETERRQDVLLSTLRSYAKALGGEKLAQDALVTALEHWPASGVPEKPGSCRAHAKHPRAHAAAGAHRRVRGSRRGERRAEAGSGIGKRGLRPGE